jgi:mannose-6-phosphate isomerase-like protein (cupin superfamily)
MPYGLTLDQVRQVNRPVPTESSWGRLTSLTEVPHYSMYRMDISAGAAQPLHFFADGPFQAFVESGDLVVRILDVAGRSTTGMVHGGEVLSLPRFSVHGFASFSGAVVYLFGPRGPAGLREILVETEETASAEFGALSSKQLIHLGQPTTDVREKYWGRIETILSSDVAAKRILVQKGGQSSLEFHVEKRESYYIHSGLLRVGLRVGRAENHSIVMKAGESYDVGPGVMHMRMGLEDTVIIEVSTRDSDSDSYLVEDGQTYRHIDVTLQPSATEKQEQPA